MFGRRKPAAALFWLTASPRRRPLRLERLEVRQLLAADGEWLSISQTFDTTGLLGELSASIHWGDGSETADSVKGDIGAGSLRVKFDYSLDTAGFFTSPRRALLNTAVDVVLSQLIDELAAIRPSGNNNWTALPLHPETGQSVSIVNPQISANEILVFVGSRDMGSASLATGGHGGFQASGTAQWIQTVQARGQSGALAANPTDFGPWGGTLSFNSRANWYFGADESQLGTNQFDFLSVATHEFIHLLGFGVAPSWRNQVVGDRFTGAKSRAAYDFDGNPPLSPDRGHWALSVTDRDGPTLMDPLMEAGRRKLVTPLDMAALDDIGWELAVGSAIVTADHVYFENGTYPVEVTLRGSRLGELTQSLSVSVTQVVPPPLFQNPADRFDVDGDGELQPLDALRILMLLAAAGGSVDLQTDMDLPQGLFPDVNGDLLVTPLDALLVLSEIGRRQRLAPAAAEQIESATRVATVPAVHWSPEIVAAPHAPEPHRHARLRVTELSHRFVSPWPPVPFQTLSN